MWGSRFGLVDELWRSLFLRELARLLSQIVKVLLIQRVFVLACELALFPELEKARAEWRISIEVRYIVYLRAPIQVFELPHERLVLLSCDHRKAVNLVRILTLSGRLAYTRRMSTSSSARDAKYLSFDPAGNLSDLVFS